MGAKSKMTDDEVIAAFNAFMEKNPYTTRHKIQLGIGITVGRLEKLGLKLPAKVGKADASRMAKISGGWGKDFRLRGSPKR